MTGIVCYKVYVIIWGQEPRVSDKEGGGETEGGTEMGKKELEQWELEKYKWWEQNHLKEAVWRR